MKRWSTYGKRASVLGAGRSGVAVANLLQKEDVRVLLSDSGTINRPSPAGSITRGIETEEGGHTARCLDADFLVLSPGVVPTIPIVAEARKRGLPVVSEIEVASWYCRSPIVAVTGTNGKTTTAALLGHLFKTAKRPVLVAGNIGLPFSAVVDQATSEHVVVLELSSFQLELTTSLRPVVSLVLNIEPDHLDRHRSLDTYAAAKMRITKNQQAQDTLVYGFDCKTTRQMVARLEGGPRQLPFSTETELSSGAFLRDTHLILRRYSSEEILMRTEQVAIRGRHNLRNALAAALAGRVMEIRSDVLRESLTTFHGVPHRMEIVRDVDGVRYVNDSKATNVNALWFALESFGKPIVLIAGGRDKGNDYTMLRPLVSEKVRAIVAIGESGEKVLDALGDTVTRAVRAYTMDEAVRLARDAAQAGDVVLLSPACASFDMFEDFEDRGNTFKRHVNEL